MTWVRIDDALPDNIKVAPLSDAAFRAYITGICYAARNLTDGFIPAKKAKDFAGRPRVIQELTPHLWEVVDGGFRIHDFLAYNPTGKEVTEKREKIRQERSKAGSKGLANRWQNDSPVPTPVAHPDFLEKKTQDKESVTPHGNAGRDDRGEPTTPADSGRLAAGLQRLEQQLVAVPQSRRTRTV